MSKQQRTIPNPDLLDLVAKNLPGENGIGVMYSITGSLSFRVARLAGMVANALASDARKVSGGIDSYNDAMSFLDTQSATEEAFAEAGFERQDMITSLRQLLSYRVAANDYLATLVGEDKLPATNWADTLQMASEPAPIDKWKLDYEWETYTTGPDADPQMTRAEYDTLTTRELSGQRASWSRHIATVHAVIDAASTGASIDFCMLDVRTQLSLLSAYATPERMAKFRASVMKRARSRFEADAGIRLHKAFVEDCQRATLHHRYANVGDKMVPKVEPMPKKVAARDYPHKDLIEESKDAAHRASVQRRLDLAAPAKKSKRQAKVAPAPHADLLNAPNDAIA